MNTHNTRQCRPLGTVTASAILAMGLFSLAIFHLWVEQGTNQVALAADAPATATAATPLSGSDTATAQSLANAFAAAAQQVLPSVVQIKSAGAGSIPRPQRSGRRRFGGNSFESPFEEEPGMMAEGETAQGVMGCGVIVDPAGVVLTNSHVVEDGPRMVVELPDGRQFPVKDVRTDPASDLAMLTVSTTRPLPAVKLGDSKSLRIGDWVMTVGSPFGLEQTVSAGIVSARNRMVEGAGRARLLQTDAAINPGSSGGALVNLQGQLVGITTAIASRDGGYQGVGFAIPADLAQWVLAQLRTHGRVRRGYIGVRLAYQLPEPAGAALAGRQVVVSGVTAASPAARAGLREGDVVLSVAGQRVTAIADVQASIERAEIGSTQQLDVLRSGSRQRLKVTVEERPDDTRSSSQSALTPDQRPQELVYSRDLQMMVRDVNASDQSNRRAGATPQGVVVMRVDRGGPASRFGIRKGMVLVRIGGQQVKDTSDFVRVMEGESLARGFHLQMLDGGLLRSIDIPARE